MRREELYLNDIHDATKSIELFIKDIEKDDFFFQ